MGLKADTQHAEYAANIDIWTKVNLACEGQDALNAYDIAHPGSLIRKPNPTDKSPENSLRYEQYVKGSSYVNIVGRTLEGLCGEVFAKEPEMDLAGGLDKYESDIDGAGVSLLQQSRRTLERTLKNGRSGLLVDYSSAPDNGERKKTDEISGVSRPTIVAYPASSIINWRSERIGSKERLSLVVISYFEEIIDPEDIFVTTHQPRVRVLSLEENVYVQRIFAKANEGKGDWEQIGPDIIPTRGKKGKTLDYIPFIFPGAVNNDTTPDKAPLLDLANVNLSHRSNSADLEDSSYHSSAFTPAFNLGDWDKDQFETANNGGLHFGPLGGIFYPAEGDFKFVQPEAATLPQAIMELKEKQMGALGARIVEPQKQAISATEAADNEDSQTSVLSSAAKNVSDAYEQCLKWMQDFNGTETAQDPVFRLNSEYSVSRLDSQTLLAVISAWQQGGMSLPEVHNYKLATGLTDNTFAEFQQEVSDNPAGLTLTLSGDERFQKSEEEEKSDDES